VTSEDVDIAPIWREVQAGMPAGWTVDSLRCASTGLDAEQRSEDWIAVALTPHGAEVQSRALTPVAALRALLVMATDHQP
jgi:hypothetical protein